MGIFGKNTVSKILLDLSNISSENEIISPKEWWRGGVCVCRGGGGGTSSGSTLVTCPKI